MSQPPSNQQTSQTVAIVGAMGPLGQRIAAQLRSEGHRVIGTWRTENRTVRQNLTSLGVELVHWDVSNAAACPEPVAQADGIIFTPILTVSGPAARELQRQGYDGRIILFSSNNVTVDTSSAVYEDLRHEEERLIAMGGDWVIIRPTMIYGYPGDGNLSRLIKSAIDFPVLPLPGDGHAFQQPIHVDDLADLSVKSVIGELNLQTPDIIGAAGPDSCTLIELFRTVGRLTGQNVVVLPLPLAPLRWGVRLASTLPVKLPLSKAQLNRIIEDKIPHTHIPDGWSGNIDIETGLKRLVADIKRGDG